MILCLHGVTKEPNFAINNRHMPVEEFDQYINYLSRNYEIVPVEFFFTESNLSVPSKRKKRIALTFDDGYLNNLTTALPVLEKYNVPASFYIISQSIEDPDYLLWADVMSLLLSCNRSGSIHLAQYHFKNNGNGYVCAELDNQNLVDYLKSLGHEKYDLLHQISAQLPEYADLKAKNPDYWRLINTEELRALAQSQLVTIGSHTAWHLNLGITADEIAANELMHSKSILETALKTEISAIAYPDGSYNDSTKSLAETAGYKQQLAVTYVNRSSDLTDGRILPRLSVSNSTTAASMIVRMNLGFGKFGF